MMFWMMAAILSAVAVTSLWRGLFALPATRRVQMTAIGVACLVPVAAFLLYDHFGSLDMPDFPRRLQHSADTTTRDTLLLRERPLIRALRAGPDNEKLWLELLQLYGKTDQPDRLRQAYDDALQSVSQPVALRTAWMRQWIDAHSPLDARE